MIDAAILWNWQLLLTVFVLCSWWMLTEYHVRVSCNYYSIHVAYNQFHSLLLIASFSMSDHITYLTSFDLISTNVIWCYLNALWLVTAATNGVLHLETTLFATAVASSWKYRMR